MNEVSASPSLMPGIAYPEHSGIIQHWIAPEPRSLILQPTTLCPMNCTYCYLPGRNLKQEMAPATATAIASAIPSEWTVPDPVEIVWHGGEPLAVGPHRFAQLLDQFESLRAEGRVQHKVQTGATLISEQWCDLFERYEIGVGVSLDGPREVNRHRVDRGGHAMFDRIVAGIETLRQREVPFTVLAVVTPDSTTRAHEILDFLAALDCPWVGINVEAQEAANVRGEVPSIDQARRFWREAFAWSRDNPGMRIREVEWLLTFLGLDADTRAADAKHDLIPTIGWDGDVVVLSPELLGVHDPGYRDFVAGNVVNDPLSEILRRVEELRYVQEFAVGLTHCKAECEFFSYCQGAHAGNRYFEHGTFAATETEHCKASFQAPVLALADLIEREGADHDDPRTAYPHEKSRVGRDD